MPKKRPTTDQVSKAKQNSSITTIKSNDITWINIINPDDEEIKYLQDKFAFHPLDLKDAYISKKAQRPQVSVRPDYVFLVFLFPVYNRQTREIFPAEVDFFIGKDFIITLHDNQLIGLVDFFKNCQNYEYYRDLYLAQGPIFLLYQILDRLFNNCLPMLDHIGEDNLNIEKQIFQGREREMVKEILIIKRNIVNFRTIMQSHRTIIRRLMEVDNPNLSFKNYRTHYEKLLTYTKDIWEILENHKETIDALQETNESSISFRLNDIMKTLTIISVIFLPLTLVASIFGMNIAVMPFSDHPQGFWIIMATMLGLSLLMLFYFKYKKWL